jgi:hypothetical protein
MFWLENWTTETQLMTHISQKVSCERVEQEFKGNQG